MMFQINYRACEELQRKIQGSIHYLSLIDQRLRNSQLLIYQLNNQAKKNIPYRSITFSLSSLKLEIEEEKMRYERYLKRLKEYCVSVETREKQLISYLKVSHQILDENQSDELSLLTYIHGYNNNQQMESLKHELKNTSLSQQDILQMILFLTPEFQQTLFQLSDLNEEEFEKERQRLLSLQENTIQEKTLQILLNQKKPKKLFNQMKKMYMSQQMEEYIELCLFGINKQSSSNIVLAFQNKNFVSLSHQEKAIEILKSQDYLIKSQDPKRITYYDLYKKSVSSMQESQSSLSSLSQLISYYSSINQQYKDYTYYGKDGIESGYHFILEQGSYYIGGIVSSSVGGYVSAQLSATLGSIGAIGGPAGVLIGVAVGSLIGGVSGMMINEIGQEVYIQGVKPSIEKMKDSREKMIEWWDALWW